MSKRIAIISLMLLFTLVTLAQKKLNYFEVDKKSYELYLDQRWDELLEYSTEARKQGIDFFYLQTRTGIAYYNLKKYRASASWFLRAWQNDQSFEWLQEYLYYSLVYGGRGTEAMKHAGNFTPAMKKKVGYANSKITRAALEGGYCFNNDFESLTKTYSLNESIDEDYGVAFYLKNYHFESFDLSHRIAPGLHVDHNFTYLGIKREQEINWGDITTFPIATKQFQYFINPHILIGKRLNISPALSVLWGNSSYFAGAIRGNWNRYFTEVDYKFTDIIFSTSLWADFSIFKPGAEVNFANIYDENFTQLSIWTTIYPLSNVNLYFTPRIYFKGDNESSFDYNTFGISGGVQFGKIHFHGQYLNGKMENFVEAAGYIVSNFPGTSEQKFTGSLYFPLGKKPQLVLRYLNQDVTERYVIYSDGNYSRSEEYDYIKHTITAGISWSF